MLRKLQVKWAYLCWAYDKSFTASPNHTAVYQGNLYYLKNEIFDEKIWTLIDVNTKTKYIRYVNIKDFVVKVTWRSFWRAFKSHYRFQMISWYMIDCRKPMGTRISYINSSDIKF